MFCRTCHCPKFGLAYEGLGEGKSGSLVLKRSDSLVLRLQ